MNNEQEMQFADPAWEPKVTREFEAIAPAPSFPGTSSSSQSAAPASQAGEAEYHDYAQGYRSQNTSTAERENPSQYQSPPSQDQQQQPSQGQQPSFQSQLSPTIQAALDWLKSWPTWLKVLVAALVLGSFVQSGGSQGGPVGALFSLILVGGLVLIGWLLWTRRVRISLSGETQTAETRTFPVSAQPTVILKNKTGSINLRAGQEGQVSIITRRRGYLFSSQFDKETPISYSQDTATNTVTARTGSWRPFGKNAITFEVTVPPQANLQLVTNFGKIQVQNVAGQMTLHSDAGSIQATNVTLQSKSRLKADAGSIVFSGSLNPSGNYEMKTDLGTINVTLATDASCDLSAQTDIGTVTTNLPSILQLQRNKAYGSIGSGPHPRLKLKTDLGTIHIQQN